MRLEFPVSAVTYEDVMATFRPAFRSAHLPDGPVASASWFASEVACGALVRASSTKARIKGTLTLPEWRGLGYGEAILLRLLDEARAGGYSSVEVFTRPAWYLRHGFKVARTTPYGVQVLRLEELGLRRDRTVALDGPSSSVSPSSQVRAWASRTLRAALRSRREYHPMNSA